MNDGYPKVLCLVGLHGVVRRWGHPVLRGARFLKVDARAATVKELTCHAGAFVSKDSSRHCVALRQAQDDTVNSTRFIMRTLDPSGRPVGGFFGRCEQGRAIPVSENAGFPGAGPVAGRHVCSLHSTAPASSLKCVCLNLIYKS